jgi:hypothetical protein
LAANPFLKEGASTRKSDNEVTPTRKDEVASGNGTLPSAAEPDHVKPQDHPTPSDRSDGRGKSLVGSKLRSTKRRARRNNRNPARLNDGAARHPKWKRPNAQKHGLFAQPLILPGEDPREFEQLYAELIEEWKPLGPTLRDAVFDHADLKWRKRRLRTYVQTQLSIDTFDPHHPAFNEVWGFCMFINCLRSEPETCFDEHARKYLRTDRINHLKQKCPRSDYQSISEWVEAVTCEILSFSFPTKLRGFETSELEAEISDLGVKFSDLEEAARQWKAEQQVAWSISHARELLDWESNESERLDARINRQIKFLFELKAMEEMLRLRTLEGCTIFKMNTKSMRRIR